VERVSSVALRPLIDALPRFQPKPGFWDRFAIYQQLADIAAPQLVKSVKRGVFLFRNRQRYHDERIYRLRSASLMAITCVTNDLYDLVEGCGIRAGRAS
jgi:hypothetical protein